MARAVPVTCDVASIRLPLSRIFCAAVTFTDVIGIAEAATAVTNALTEIDEVSGMSASTFWMRIALIEIGDKIGMAAATSVTSPSA